MLGWLRKLRARKPPLTGAAAVRRQKTYSAASGYVYQYFYEGYRAAQGGGQGTAYVFQVTADRKTFFPVSVLIPVASLAEFERGHGRGLNANERYAVAKMALFQAFDERATPDRMKAAVLVRTADLEAILGTLGIE